MKTESDIPTLTDSDDLSIIITVCQYLHCQYNAENALCRLNIATVFFSMSGKQSS